MSPVSWTATGPAKVAPAVPYPERHLARLDDPFQGSPGERQPVGVHGEGHIGRLTGGQPHAGEPDQLGHRTRHTGDRIRGVQLHDLVSASRSGVADGDGQLNASRSVDLDRTGARDSHSRTRCRTGHVRTGRPGSGPGCSRRRCSARAALQGRCGAGRPHGGEPQPAACRRD